MSKVKTDWCIFTIIMGCTIELFGVCFTLYFANKMPVPFIELMVSIGAMGTGLLLIFLSRFLNK